MSKDKIDRLKNLNLIDDETAKRSEELINKLEKEYEDKTKSVSCLMNELRFYLE